MNAINKAEWKLIRTMRAGQKNVHAVFLDLVHREDTASPGVQTDSQRYLINKWSLHMTAEENQHKHEQAISEPIFLPPEATCF